MPKIPVITPPEEPIVPGEIQDEDTGNPYNYERGIRPIRERNAVIIDHYKPRPETGYIPVRKEIEEYPIQEDERRPKQPPKESDRGVTEYNFKKR